MNFAVIGASRGLGLCLTQALLEQGHAVAAGTRSPSEKLDALQERWPQKLLTAPADVTDEAGMAGFASSSAGFLGKIDAVCIAAGVLLDQDRVRLLHQCDIGELRRTFEVNVIGPVIAVKAFFPYLDKGAKVFIVTSEGVGVTSCGTWLPCYALSKTAATKVSGILNASVEGVDFYSVHPGRMNTDMGRTTAQIEPEEAAQGFVRLMTGQTPLSRDRWYIDYLGKEMKA